MSTSIAVDHELTIPARFVALFRLAIAEEVHSDAGWVATESHGVVNSLQADGCDPRLFANRLTDLGGPGDASRRTTDCLSASASTQIPRQT